MEPEYLSLFSNAGGTAVSVHFTDNDGSIREQLMHPHELTKLIGHDEQGFLAQMFFDEQLMRLDRIEILVGKNQVILHVRREPNKFKKMRPVISDHDIWVGSSYQASRPKILILGESDYGDTPLLTDYIPQWLDGHPRDPTFARVSNAFAGSIPRSEFWNQIAFYNFVPGKVGETRDHRPTIGAYVNAKPILTEVLNILKPDGVLILGIEQSEYSQPVVQKFGVAHVVSPHPASYGLKNERLTAAWNDLIHSLEASG